MALIESPEEVRNVVTNAAPGWRCGGVLMASPTYFAVETALNPWATDDRGNLNAVDTAAAVRQWDALADAYRGLKLCVDMIDAPKGLADFCFAANQSLVFVDEEGKSGALLSRMASESRAPEVEHFKAFYREQGYTLHELPEGFHFEGAGDAIRHADKRLHWGGVGPRTDEAAWDQAGKLIGPVIPLRLADPRFYHLDTCLCVLDAETAMYYPPAFDEPSCERLKAGFKHLCTVSDADAANFACNAHCPDGKHVLMQQGSGETAAWLKDSGFEVIELDTSEFMKSGGSVFCLKQELP
ncbi:MAG: amidinotransferase [Planctomycetes bacterium]|nr:amidinotransferase [Planctomycetota bacterium]